MNRPHPPPQDRQRNPGLRVIEITGGVKVVCPSEPGLITPYVLEEQGDWFEDEIRFMRTIIDPDGVFFDVGANYGLYSLSAAKLSPRGKVWSYEPAASTAACLTRSIEANGFGNVTLMRQAVSDRTGTGWLQDMGGAELNALGDAGRGTGEAITLTTLDHELATHDWRRADIVKIDVEGHEASVIAGGRRFFSDLSPLVMLEVKSNTDIDLDATRRLTGLGYQCWRLVPGLAALAPQDAGAPIDDYQLNLFCCKKDRADLLARADKLVKPSAGSVSTPCDPPRTWREYLGGFPHARSALAGWIDQTGRHPLDGWETYRTALDHYADAMDPERPIDARYESMQASHAGLKTLLKTRANASRLLSFARIATDFGMRRQAVEALRFLLGSFNGYTPADFMREPWLSPSTEFDAITPHGVLHDWALAAVLEAFERLRGFSSFFVDTETTQIVTGELARLGYLIPAMQRRATLAQSRTPRK